MIKIGEKLREERRKRGLSLDQVSRSTRIRVSFLQAIEEGHFEKLPGSSYAHGFVKNYLELLGLPIREYLALFRREYDEKENKAVLPQGMIARKGIALHRFSLRQAFLLGGVILLGLFTYLFLQYRATFFPPLLSVSSPKEHAQIASQIVEVSGVTNQNTQVTVNNLPAFVDTTGHFSKEIPVFPGNVTLTIKAENSFGKISTVERHIQVTVAQ